MPGSASTASTVPRATTRASTIRPLASGRTTNDTSRPCAAAISARTRSRTPGANRSTLTLPRSRLELALLGGGEQHVIEDEPVARRVRMQRQVGGRIADLMLLVLGVVPSEEGPGALA